MKFQKDTIIKSMEVLYLISKSKNVKWQLETRELCFLYSYLYRFFKKNNIELFEGDILFEGEKLFLLRQLFESVLNDLILDTYLKPNEKEVSKHSTRFERFKFNDKKYIVNYTTSISGRLIYLLYLRTEFIIEEIKENNGGMILSIKKDFDIYW
jgi:hypothetical protein